MQTSIWRRLGQRLGMARVIRAMNLYPPYVGAGIRITHVAPDLSAFEVELRERPWNRNWVGTHFGGSLYAMCDPFFMLILLERLGDGYVAWDKSAAIRFVKPGRGTVRARFAIDQSRLAEVREAADREGKHDARFVAEVADAKGEVVARVEKVVQVRRKDVSGRAPAGGAADSPDRDRPPEAAAGR